MKPLLLSAFVILVSSTLAFTQQCSIVTAITGHVAKPDRLESSDSRAKLSVLPGFELTTFATGLAGPRVLAVANDRTVYVTRT
jgi:hypothetical protein